MNFKYILKIHFAKTVSLKFYKHYKASSFNFIYTKSNLFKYCFQIVLKNSLFFLDYVYKRVKYKIIWVLTWKKC